MDAVPGVTVFSAQPAAGTVGTLADLRDARHSLQNTAHPWWMRAAMFLAFASVITVQILVPRLLEAFGFLTVLGLVFAGQLFLLGVVLAAMVRNRPIKVRPRRFHVWSRSAFGAVWAVVAGAVVAFTVLMVLWVIQAISGWAVVTGVFASQAAAFLGIYPIGWRMDPYGSNLRSLRDVPDQPATMNPLLVPRQQLRLCAILAPVDSMGEWLATKTLMVSPSELSLVCAPLIQAQLLGVSWHEGTWWFGLSPVGRAAYRRHLRALEAADVG